LTKRRRPGIGTVFRHPAAVAVQACLAERPAKGNVVIKMAC